MPDFAKYLDKYATASKYRAVVTDKRGGRWVEFAGADNYMTLRLRTHQRPFRAAQRSGSPDPK